MRKSQKREVLAVLWCLLNVGTNTDVRFSAMKEIEKMLGDDSHMEKWRELSKDGYLSASAMKQIKILLS
jgi:hypothetical protein